jgi:ACS family glucarate transporter-like MFS transporter/ACS family D-galactonate transporter-like MFS transporter
MFRAAGYMFFASWLPSFLQKTRGVSIKDSGEMQAVVFAAALAGSLLGGLFVDWVYRQTNSKTFSRQIMGSTCMMLCGLLVLGAYFVGHAMAAIVLISLGVFLAAIGGPCALAAVIDVSGDHVPEVTAIMNSAGNLAVAATPVLVGMFFEATNDWNLVLWGFAAIYVAAAACWLFVDVERPFRATGA